LESVPDRRWNSRSFTTVCVLHSRGIQEPAGEDI
jgi:hypothetical protein